MKVTVPLPLTKFEAFNKSQSPPIVIFLPLAFRLPVPIIFKSFSISMFVVRVKCLDTFLVKLYKFLPGPGPPTILIAAPKDPDHLGDMNNVPLL